MNEVNNDLYTLLRLGLNNALPNDILELEKNQIDWDRVSSLSKQHCVLGIVFDGMNKLKSESRPIQPLFLNWCAQVLGIQEANKSLDTAVVSLFKTLDNNGIDVVLMKGQGVALNYPNSLRRQSGDIDVYVGDTSYQRTNELMETLGAKVVGDEIIKHKSWLINGVEVEVHKEMAVLSKPSHYKYFKKLIKGWFPNKLELLEINNTPIFVAPAQFDAIFLLVHILEHLLREGIGLRQPIDWLLFLDTHKENIDSQQLENDLKNTGLLELAASLIGVGAKYLGFNQLKGLLQYKAEEQNVELLLKEIMQSGNFGVVEKIKNANSAERGYVFRKVYSLVNISRRLKRMYPLAKGEAFWFLWFTLKNSIYTRIQIIKSKK